MNLNVLVRGQSNAFAMMEEDGRAGVATLTAEVARLLGFDGTNDTVTLIYDPEDAESGTVFGGTAFIGDWLSGAPGAWSVGPLEGALLAELNALPVSLRDDPTATLWFHSEYDSRDAGLTASTWTSAVRFDAGEVREMLGQEAATTPYLFVSAMPYNQGTGAGHQAIREGMELLAADAGFNGHIAARIQDIDAAGDDLDGNPSTREYGGEHLDGGDAAQVIARAARGIAEAFAMYARPGSPLADGNIADDGPEVIRAERVASNTVLLDVRHDAAGGFAALDPQAGEGAGWSVIAGGGQVVGRTVEIVDSDTLRVTFSGDLPEGGRLFYGYGYGRLAAPDGNGRGNAVYDDRGLPIWVQADGLAVAGLGSGPPPAPHAPASITVGAGADALVLAIAQDAFLGDAQYVVRVDGRQIGGTLTASALKSAGQADTLTVLGDWSAGPHGVEVEFLNDIWAGTPDTDRNLYVEGARYNGTELPGAVLAFGMNGSQGFSFGDDTGDTPPPPPPPPGNAPASITVGAGAEALVLAIAQDAFLGDAQYVVRVDGRQIGGTLTASALKSSGETDTLTVLGDWSAGPHGVQVEFLNDIWGGTPDTDRNLYVEGARYNGMELPGAVLAFGMNGSQGFSFGDDTGDTPPLPPSPQPPGNGTGTITVGAGSDRLMLAVAQDEFIGDAEYVVRVDGRQIGGTLTASALKSSGETDSVVVLGDWSAGAHQVEVEFLNDIWGGTPDTDRNLYVEGASYNGEAISGAVLAFGMNGRQGFSFTDGESALIG